MKEFEINVIDGGDMSVGLQSECAIHAVLSDNMINHLKEYKLLDEFETKLKALVEEFYEPETVYAVEDTDMVQAEIEWEKEQERIEKEIEVNDPPKIAGRYTNTHF